MSDPEHVLPPDPPQSQPPVARPRNPSRAWRRRIVWVSVLLLLVSTGAGVLVLSGWPWAGSEVQGQAEPAEHRAVVKTVKPRRDPSFRVAVPQLAFVEPFLEADIRPRVAGVVSYIHKE